MNLAELSAFAASLNNLDRKEIQKAKVLFIKNKITEHKASCQTMPLFLIWAGIVCGFPFFAAIAQFSLISLLAFVPTFFFYMAFSQVRTDLRSQKQQIGNALEIWEEDLGNDYFELKTKLKNTKSNIPIISTFLNN